MCISLAGKVIALNGPLAQVEREDLTAWYNALMQPEVHIGDFVLTHANLIVAIISEHEAAEMAEAAREIDAALARETAGALQPITSEEEVS
jgi:hydrogenase expression/formation protein HypC